MLELVGKEAMGEALMLREPALGYVEAAVVLAEMGLGERA